jgi:short-subunit dehydrogenase
MRDWNGKTAMVTGAAGGLGRCLARHLGRAGLRLMLHDLPGTKLETVCADLVGEGSQAAFREGDIRDAAERRGMVDAARVRWGEVDLLVNNAGVEFTARYHELSEERIREAIAVNLEAPMALTRLLLPRMLERRQGHIINLSSLAGMSGPAFQEPYAATKAALRAFTFSLRASYRGTGVSASVICPGFVEAGIYPRLRAVSGKAAPILLAGCPPEWVARAVLRCLRRDRAEVIVSRYPLRPVLALATLSPGLGAWLTRRLGVNEFFRRVVDAERGRPPAA